MAFSASAEDMDSCLCRPLLLRMPSLVYEPLGDCVLMEWVGVLRPPPLMISLAVRGGIEMENLRRAEMGFGRPLATSLGEELIRVEAVVMVDTSEL